MSGSLLLPIGSPRKITNPLLSGPLPTTPDSIDQPSFVNDLNQVLSDIGQDRQDLLSYISKLEESQQLLLSELRLMKKQNSTLVYQDNLRHLAICMEARPAVPVRGGQDDVPSSNANCACPRRTG
jgi:hypothetical protein